MWFSKIAALRAGTELDIQPETSHTRTVQLLKAGKLSPVMVALLCG